MIKEQEANRFLSNLGLKTPLSKILLLGDTLLFLAGDKNMPGMDLSLDIVLVDYLLKTKKKVQDIFTKMS